MRSAAVRDERGAAVVEFALILPLLVLFIFGIIEFGRAYSAKIELTAAVREGARAAALGGPTYTEAQVKAKVEEAAPGLKQVSTVDVTYPVPPLATCPANPAPTETARVEASYDFEYNIPLFGQGTWTLHAKGVMRCGG